MRNLRLHPHTGTNHFEFLKLFFLAQNPTGPFGYIRKKSSTSGKYHVKSFFIIYKMKHWQMAKPCMSMYTVFHQYPDSHSTMRVQILVEHSVVYELPLINVIIQKLFPITIFFVFSFFIIDMPEKSSWNHSQYKCHRGIFGKHFYHLFWPNSWRVVKKTWEKIAKNSSEAVVSIKPY